LQVNENEESTNERADRERAVGERKSSRVKVLGGRKAWTKFEKMK